MSIHARKNVQADRCPRLLMISSSLYVPLAH
jgi:hypothetical protein